MLRINMYLFINNRQVDKLHEKKKPVMNHMMITTY